MNGGDILVIAKRWLVLVLVLTMLPVVGSAGDEVTLDELMEAVESGDVARAKTLLDQGADIGARGLNEAPLLAAAKIGDVNIVKVLMDKGADVTTRATKGRGRTALGAAQEGGYKEIEEILRAHGAKE
jgi:hypothetical protein